MLRLGVQTRNIVEDENPAEGFAMLRGAGFSCADFSLNQYLSSADLYKGRVGHFFDRSERELADFFAPHKRAAGEAGVAIHQMHMPYPSFVPGGSREVNEYLREVVAPKSLRVCAFFGCRYIVMHGMKLARQLGSEEREWEETEGLVRSLAPLARELGVTICLENLYDGVGGHLVEGPCCDAKKMAGRIDRINGEYHAQVLGFCFDTGHANLIGIDQEDFLTTLGDRLKVLHIHDNDGAGDLHQIPFTFARSRENRASTDWDGFLGGLRNIGFNGVLSFETAPVLTAFPDAMKPDVLAFLAKIGEYFAGEVEGGSHPS